MSTVSVQEAQSKLTELIHKLKPGDEVIITENNQPVAKLVAQGPAARRPRKPGSCKGMLTIVSDDDEHLEDFKEYMP